MIRDDMYHYETEHLMLGPVETQTGTKFGIWLKDDPRGGGPIATFNGRDSAVEWMERDDGQSL